MADAQSGSVNVPQILVIIVVGFLAIRWFFSASTAAGSLTQNASSQRGRTISPAMVDQVAQMFPQLDRRDIMWDLQRNGGNRQRTIERVLSGRALETPPQSFQPNVGTPAPTGRSTGSSASTSTQSRSAHPDLISRYKLQDKINATSSEEASTEQKIGWSQNKSERQQIMQRRREEMILAARKKMEEKDKAGKA